MTRSLRELDADLSKVTPERAKYDYWNAIQNLLVCMPDPMDDEVFQQRLREWADRGRGFVMYSFTQGFPPDRYPGIIEAQPPGLVARFDAIAEEMNTLYRAGQLTGQKVLEVAEEMRRLCYG